METSIDVALVGYGYVGKIIHAPLIASVPGLRLAAVVSSDAGKVHADLPDVEVAAEPDEVFARPEIGLVVIATPNETHAPLARGALLAGKHVVIDKPFTVTTAEAEELEALAGREDRLLSAFHNRRWDADFRTVSQLIESGTLGEVVQFESHIDRFRPEVRDRWRERPGPGSGLWYDLGPHLVDQALVLFGPPLGVYADLSLHRPGARAVDYFHILMRYERLRVILHGSVLVAGGSPRFVVHGTAGSYVKHGLDSQEAVLKQGGRPGSDGWGHDLRDGELWRPSPDGSVEEATVEAVPTLPGDYPAYYAGVRDAILHGAPNPVPPADAIACMRVLELGEASSETACELAFGAQL